MQQEIKFTQEQMKLIEKYRDINTEDEFWHELLIDDFVEQMEELGLKEVKLSYSGFWSQGDGASFTGRVQDTKKFLIGTMGLNPLIAEALEDWITIDFDRTTHHYVHEKTCRTNVYWDGEEEIVLLDRLDIEIKFNAEEFVEDLESKIEDWRYSTCKEIYRSLGKEWDRLSSDEEVWETLQANDIV
jgi:hypothetical protein